MAHVQPYSKRHVLDWVWIPLAMGLIVWWYRRRPLGALLAKPARVPFRPQPRPTRAKSSSDDLKIIEGIGPKIDTVFKAAGITTFEQLANTRSERLNQILRDAHIKLADPGTWGEQARLAAKGDWEGLRQLQAKLKGGRRR